jgi:hypothetical protein
MFFGIIKLVGLVLFLYLTWRNLNDSYKDDLLISYSWLCVLAFMVAGRLTFGIVNWGVWNDKLADWLLFWVKPGFDYWGGLAGIFGITVWLCRQYGWKLWSFLEDMTGTIYLFMAFLLADVLWTRNFDFRVLVYILISVVGYMLSAQISGRYRSLVWYKSGKKGFVFFFTNSIAAVLLLIQAIFYKDRPTVWISYLLLSLISLTGLFILGEVFDRLEIFGKRRSNGSSR